MSLRDDLLSDLSKAGFSPIGAELANLAKECVRMRSTPSANESIAIGASKLGGLPDLPPGLAWPEWKSGYLTFVAQVNLAELPAGDLLPDVGMLSFFYDSEQSAWGFDPNHKEGFRLWYFPEVSHLIRSVEPATSTFPGAKVSFEPFLSLPDFPAGSVRDALLKIENHGHIATSLKSALGRHRSIKYSAGRTSSKAIWRLNANWRLTACTLGTPVGTRTHAAKS
jgi:Domain of unknown function (DUF1963)